ncbi:MAG: electron transport complex protein RnfA [Gammaproteobacteria bacterium]
MTELFLVFIAACLANNLILDHLLGISPVFAVSRSIETAIGMSMTMFLVLPVTTVFCYALNVFLLAPMELEFLQLLGFVIIVSLLSLFIEKLLQKCRPALHEKITVFLPLLLVNVALVGVALLDVQEKHGFVASLFFGMGSALGFGIIVVIFTALRQRIVAADVPTPFQGVSILLITLGIISMAFMGFTGIA